jgi:hypothetical protein
MIAAAVRDGKTVLFVAEKMAALDVVKRRLDEVDLGSICLELHSRKTNKRAVHEEFRRALTVNQCKVGDLDGLAASLKDARDCLNVHAENLHRPLQPSGLTAFQIVGELVRMKADGVPPADFGLVEPLTWSRTQLKEKRNLLNDVVIHLRAIGDPRRHPWRGVMLDTILPMELERLKSKNCLRFPNALIA